MQLKGDYQRQNVPGVLGVIDQLKKNEFDISDVHIRNGLVKTIDLTGIKGRWQTLQEEPQVICDTGHNLDGIKAILSQLSTVRYKKLFIVWGMVEDKDAHAVLNLLPKVCLASL